VPVTVKVNGAANSLVHKGSNHISAATIPDVCKTPSPGGPIPIPYPNISQSATLDKGTTTVKADGGMMVATKGSEFSLSNGDNAGVAGGVKSSTFMKESTWILYSFDVKMDGSNACRLSDKKFQNHENTADLMGAVGVPVVVAAASLLPIKCANAPASSDKKFTDCEKEEICAKCDDVNAQAKAGKLKRSTGTAYEINRADGDYITAKLNAKAKAGARNQIPFTPVKSAKCAKELKDKAEATNYESVSGDHIHEIQLGGHPGHPGPITNLRWMSRRGNEWVGTTLKGYDPKVHTGVKPDCC